LKCQKQKRNGFHRLDRIRLGCRPPRQQTIPPYRERLALDVTPDVAGAVAGGLAFDVLGVSPSAAFAAAGGAISAAAGAVVLLACYRAIFHAACV